MFSCREILLAALLTVSASVALAQTGSFPGIGRAATAKEVAAWDIDVRPDFKGLPSGAGSVQRGQDLWEAQCASCHGVFGESNEVFTPLIGGTTAADMKSGRVARLTDPAYPGRTTMMKLPTLSTLWDYIHRAMPWNAPKSLSHDDVYALTAFMLNLAGVVPDNFSLSDQNIAQVQQTLPNRHGMSTEHSLWPGRSLGPASELTRVPDVRAAACLRDCGSAPTVKSSLPDFARNAHGNLAEQNRLVGPQRGADTTRPATAAAALAATAAATLALAPAAAAVASPAALARKHNCLACHGVDSKIVGPGLREVAKKYAGRSDAAAYLLQRIVGGGAGVWGPIAMPAQTLPSADAQAIAQWLAEGARP